MEENEGKSLLFVPGQCELPWHKLRCSASCPGEYPPLLSNRGAEMEENEGRLLLLVLRAVRAALAQAQVVPVAVPAALVNIHLCSPCCKYYIFWLAGAMVYKSYTLPHFCKPHCTWSM